MHTFCVVLLNHLSPCHCCVRTDEMTLSHCLLCPDWWNDVESLSAVSGLMKWSWVTVCCVRTDEMKLSHCLLCPDWWNDFESLFRVSRLMKWSWVLISIALSLSAVSGLMKWPWVTICCVQTDEMTLSHYLLPDWWNDVGSLLCPDWRNDVGSLLYLDWWNDVGS